MSDAVTIRPAEARDADDVAWMARELMIVLGDGDEHFDAERFKEDAFGEQPQFSVLVAERGGKLAGYALFHDAYEPAHAARGVYLCDLYVREEHRGQGIGRTLIAAVAKDGASRGRTFVWWVSRGRGDAANALYRKLTGVHADVTAYAITYETFDKMALE